MKKSSKKSSLGLDECQGKKIKNMMELLERNIWMY